MKKLLLSILIGTATLCHAFGIETSVGVTGLGIGITLPIQQSDFSIKLNANTFQFNNLGIDANIQSYGVLLGYNLWKGLSVNGGVYYLNGFANDTEKFNISELSNQQQNANGSVLENYQVNGFSPYAGVNYKADIYKGWYFSTDVGVMQINYKTDEKIIAQVNRENYNYNQQNNKSMLMPIFKVSIGFDF
jgi:hypothetical protein